MSRTRTIVPFEVRSSSDDGRDFEGYASTFYKIDDYGSIIDRGAFDETLEFFLAEGFIGGLNHDWNKPIGKPLSATTDAKGLLTRGSISATTDGINTGILLKDKVVRKLSIGFTTSGYEWLETEADVQSYWETHGYTPDAEDLARCKYGALLKTRVKLYEYSPVTFASNGACDITDVRAANLADHLNAQMARIKTGDGEVTPEMRSQLLRLRGDCDEILGRSTDVVTPEDTEMRASFELDLLELEADFLALGGRL